MKIKGIEFEVEVDWDRDGRIENMAVFLPNSDVELSEVLSEKVLDEIEQWHYNNSRDDINEDDWREDR